MATVTNQCKETDTAASDEFDKTFICQPCKEDKKQLSAVGYCVNCREYLCQRCYECHLVPSLTKKHVLLDQNHMPGLEQSENDPMCPCHRDEEIKYHCAPHSFVGCHVCFYSHQKTCKETVYIPEFINSVSLTDELNSINKRLSAVTNTCSELDSYIKDQRHLMDSQCDEAISNMKKFKREILDLIYKLEKEVSDNAIKLREEQGLPITLLSKQYQAIMMEIQNISSRIESLQSKEHNYEFYIAIQKSKDVLLKIEDTIQGLTYDKQIKQFVFKPNDDLSRILKSNIGLGSLQLKGVIAKAEYVRDINVKTANDGSSCSLSCSVKLSGNKLIVSDISNNSIKLVDTKQSKVIFDLKFSTYPWGVCAVGETAVAVTLCCEKKIVFVSTDSALRVMRKLEVNGNPYGIGYHDGKLIVSYISPQKVEIMDIQGNIIDTFNQDNSGQNLFRDPYEIAVNPRNSLIYVSNHSSKNMVCMRMDGTVIATYNDDEINLPMQIDFDEGNNVYLCGRGSNNVHQLTEDCKKVKVILTSADGLMYPNTITYQENDDLLYIGQDNDCIKVYQLKYTNA